MLDYREYCHCHALSREDFRAAVATGATKPKAAFKHHDRMPKCCKCLPMVRDILAEQALDQKTTTHTQQS